MNFLIPFLTTFVSLVVVDSIWLKLMATFYRERLGHLFAESFSLTPAVFFYPLYALALTVLVVMPAIKNGSSLAAVLGLSALLGLAAYGAYDLTNAATLKNWPLSVTFVDMLWGATITTIAGLLAFYVSKFF